MTNWKEVIVGDAFRIPSRDLNYYRDNFLICPFIFFTIAGLTNLLTSAHDHRLGLKWLALSLVCILLARERIVLIGSALGFYIVQGLLAFFLKHEWGGLALAAPSGVLFLVLFRYLKNYKPSYGWPRGLTVVSVLVGLSSFGFSLAVLRWMGR